jgi:hypothetical protein
MKTIIKFLKIFTFSLFIFVILVYVYFRISAPEGMEILKHYCFGDGSELVLESDYLPNSPVIQSELKKLKIGQDKVVRFYQKEDWRLSYALNPFHLVKKRDGFEIYQYIKFDSKGVDVTELNFYLFKIRLKDSWVHLVNPKPFMVKYKYHNSNNNNL